MSCFAIKVFNKENMESVVLPEANQSQDGKFGNFYCVLKNVF